MVQKKKKKTVPDYDSEDAVKLRAYYSSDPQSYSFVNTLLDPKTGNVQSEGGSRAVSEFNDDGTVAKTTYYLSDGDSYVDVLSYGPRIKELHRAYSYSSTKQYSIYHYLDEERRMVKEERHEMLMGEDLLDAKRTIVDEWEREWADGLETKVLHYYSVDSEFDNYRQGRYLKQLQEFVHETQGNSLKTSARYVNYQNDGSVLREWTVNRETVYLDKNRDLAEKVTETEGDKSTVLVTRYTPEGLPSYSEKQENGSIVFKESVSYDDNKKTVTQRYYTGEGLLYRTQVTDYVYRGHVSYHFARDVETTDQ